jgi:hypothetical protein
MEPARPARVERRLAAILAADVAGYSRLMGADEVGTLERLKALRRRSRRVTPFGVPKAFISLWIKPVESQERHQGGIAMKSMLSRSRTVLLAALAGGLVAAVIPAAAQRQAKPPAVNPSPAPVPGLPALAPGAPPPGWRQGAPDNPATADIAPVVPPPIPLAVDKLPVGKLKLQPGFQIEVFAAGLSDARSLRVDDKGNVYVSTRRLVWCFYKVSKIYLWKERI